LRSLIDLGSIQPGSAVPQLVEAIGENDEPIATVKITPQSVTVRPRFTTAPGARSLTVKPVFEGKPADGFESAGYTLEPTQVAVDGNPELVDRYQEISTRPISLRGLRASTPIEAQLEVPPGVHLLSSGHVVVKVMVKPARNGSDKS
jgi:YbbR domain-containing protein